MNEKIRGILRTAWNEPRHFFFWLTMLSLLGLISITVGVAAAPSGSLAQTGARLLVTPLAYVTLACFLGVVLGIPAFILAWIPPCRRLFVRLLGWRWLALACLVTLVAFFYAIEDWRGRHAWQTYKTEREAKGERFAWASLAPPLVPKEQNFFESPLWEDLRFTETNGAVVWRDTNWSSHVIFSTYGPKADHAPSPGGWSKAQRVDLAAWQAFYRGSNNLFAAEGGEATNFFPVASQRQAPAIDVLLALSRFETNRQLLVAAAGRPQARFWINYDAGFGALLPHLARLKGCAQYLSLHADAALKVGDRGAALEDVRVLFRITAALRAEPLLISQLVGMAVLQVGLQPVWEGLADRQWTEADLGVIEGELGRLDFLADYKFGMRGERACSIWAVDYVRRNGFGALGELGAGSENASGRAEAEKAMSRMLFQLVPSGWFDQNKLSLCRNQERYLLPAVDQEKRLVSPRVAVQLQTDLGNLRMSPYDVLSKKLMPALAGCAERFARAQTTVDLARVACALERYRLGNGQLPETLEALAPKYIANPPHDVISGQPLKYRRTEDGQFVLYSVGWNESDEGGKVELTKPGGPDPKKGDWVWRYPSKGQGDS